MESKKAKDGKARRSRQCYARIKSDPVRYARVQSLRRASYARLKYGLTLAEYDAMLSQACESCGERNPGKMHLDHDHETGRVRGTLCGPCNRALGQAKDSPARLRALADYVERVPGNCAKRVVGCGSEPTGESHGC